MSLVELNMLAWTPGPWEIAIIVIAILVLFGGKKLPELARGMGRAMREFRSELKKLNQDVDEVKRDVSGEQQAEQQYRQAGEGPKEEQPEQQTQASEKPSDQQEDQPSQKS